MRGHREIREGDEYYCPDCGKRWDMNDPEPPPCISRQEKGLKQIAKLRKLYGYKS